MREFIPYPSITASDTPTQVQQLKSYLIQLKDVLEDVLTNLSSDNLSDEVKTKLDTLSKNIEKVKEEAAMNVITKKSVDKKINNKKYVIEADINTGIATIKGEE